MIDTYSVQHERATGPKDEIRCVRQKEILPTVPNEVQWPGKKEKTQKYAIVERKYTQRSARIKSFEEVRAGYGIEQNAGYKKAGEGKEKIDADKGGGPNRIQEVEDAVARVGVGPEEVMVQHKENRETAKAVQGEDVIFCSSVDTGSG
jgi:hypothetical protein